MTGLPAATRLLRWLTAQGPQGTDRDAALLWLRHRGLGPADAEAELRRVLASGEAYEGHGRLLPRGAPQPEPALEEPPPDDEEPFDDDEPPPDEEPVPVLATEPAPGPTADLVSALLAMSEADWHAVACARVEVRKARSRMAKASAAERRARDKIADLLTKGKP